MIALVLALGAALVTLGTWCRRVDPRLVPYAAASLVFHLLSATGQDWLQSFYGVTDLVQMADYGKPIASALQFDFTRNAPELVKLLLHLDANFGFIAFDQGSSTSTMYGITAFFLFAVSNSFLVCFLTVAVMAWFSQLLLARTLSELLPHSERPIAYAAALLVPSVIFWSSGIIKEAFVLVSMGPVAWGLLQFTRGRRLAGAVTAGVGAVGIAMLKPYLLFPFVVAVGVMVGFRRGRFRALPLWSWFVGAVLAFGGVLAMGALFPDYSVNHLAENIASHQATGQNMGGGSDVEIGGDEAMTLPQQMRFLPLAMLNCLLRPIPTDVHNITTAAAAVESIAISAIIIVILTRARLYQVQRVLLSDPLLVFSAVFTVTCAAAIGLATTNIGTLSRYRMPMMPFYVLLLLVLYRRVRALAPRGRTAENQREPSLA